MARAPETGFYFEPIGERLALVVEGSPFPSDDHWAWLGDPIAMTPEQAQLLVAVRWPGVDPSTLEVEFDLNFDRAVKAQEAAALEKKLGITHTPMEFDLDIDQLLEQAEQLRQQVRQAQLDSPSKLADEAAAEAETLRALIARAKELAEPATPGRAMATGAAHPQSLKLLHGGEEPREAGRASRENAESRAQSGPERKALILPPAETKPAPLEEQADQKEGQASRLMPQADRKEAEAPPLASPVVIPEIVREEPARKPEPRKPRPAQPKAPAQAAKPPPEPEAKPEPKPGPRRPNIRDKR